MAVQRFSFEGFVPLGRATVWQRFLDPDTLQRCIPGCESVLLDTDHRYRICVRYKLGPLSRDFRTTVMAHDIVPQQSLRFRRGSYQAVSGNGAFNGQLALVDEGEGTRFRLEVDVTAPAAMLKLVAFLAPRDVERTIADALRIEAH